jgi:peptidoglycan hydrolase-like protein with peptidoglycan-binding domain
MTGSDVAAWQSFLAAKGLLHANADGVFGPLTAQATRDYQAEAGLGTDGVVGPATLRKAVSDGFVIATGSNMAGMDASANCSPFAQRLVDAGMKFVARYYSDFPSKVLTPSEADALSAAGLQLVAVFEDSNDSAARFTSGSGQSNAQKALQFAASIGQPAGSAIYFAVDYDASPADVAGPVSHYFQAVQQVLGAAPVSYAAGVYGSGLTCRVIRDSALAKFTWLSGSTGFRESAAFRSQADILQFAPSRSLFEGQLNIDDDVAQSADFGSFRLAQAQQPPAGPT